jgi:hypothetical protein
MDGLKKYKKEGQVIGASSERIFIEILSYSVADFLPDSSTNTP